MKCFENEMMMFVGGIWLIRMIICKRLVPLDNHLQEAVHPNDHSNNNNNNNSSNKNNKNNNNNLNNNNNNNRGDGGVTKVTG